MTKTLPARRHTLRWGTSLAAALVLPGRVAASTSAPAPATASAPAAAAVPAPGEHARTFSGVVRKPVSLRYLLWMPRTARPAGGWPLLLFLHGSGQRGDDLAQVKVHGPPKDAQAVADRGFVLVAPQVPEGLAWDSDSLEALRAHLVAQLPVDADRVLMTGLSMGGIGTWNYAADYPDRLAAIAPVCGIGDIDRAARVARLPIWAFHGARDTAVPFAGAQEMVDAVRAAGGHVKFTVYADVGHEAWDPAYADPQLYDWLLAQRRGTSR
jgi:predicted peptidase